MKENAILELKGIGKQYRDHKGDYVKVVENVNLIIKPGECIGLVGESGCGKSTLARIISHLTQASEGAMFFKGEDITQLQRKNLKQYYKEVQMIFQNPLDTFSSRMTMGQYLAEPFINFKRMPKKEAYAHAKALLQMVNLESHCMKKYPNELSGGQLQRIVIARAMGIKPSLIICDECTSALDVSIQKDIIELLFDMKAQQNYASLFITHDIALAENICDRIYIMYEGKLVDMLGSKNIMAEAKHPYTKTLLNSVLTINNYTQKVKVS